MRQIDVWDVSVKELSYDTFERIYSRYFCGLMFVQTRNKICKGVLNKLVALSVLSTSLSEDHTQGSTSMAC